MSSGLLPGLLRVASRVICLIVILSFALFVVDQTGKASEKQQNEISSGVAQSNNSSSSSAKPKHNAIRKAIDKATAELESPFAGVTSGWSSQWAIEIVRTLIALAIYGFALGFLARFLKVQV